MSDTRLRTAHRPMHKSERTAREVFFAMLAASSIGVVFGLVAITQIIG
ncbi:MAG TPA: hypothetical protein VIG68_02955 [Lysobacter sp.]